MFELQQRSLRAYVKAFNKHDAKAVAALYAEEAAFIERGDTVTAGSDTIQSNYQAFFDAFPDCATAITRSWHFENTVVFEYVEGGTNTGTHRLHKPTGKKVGYMGASVLVFKADGRMTQDTTYYDELTKEVQAGWAPAALAKMEVRPMTPVPAATDTWEVHQVKEGQAAKANAEAVKKHLASMFSVRSEKDFLAGLSDDVVFSEYDEPKDAKGQREAGLLAKDWTKMFADGTLDATETWSVDGYVVLLGTFTGKHVGTWGPIKPTNKTFKSHFLDIARLNKDQKIDRTWSYANNYEMLNSLGFYKNQVFDSAALDPMNANIGKPR